jgi:lipopolysaccharide cholinephosphotransferase
MVELEMLIEVDRICRKCEIKYQIFAGTMLGAIRHKGFIPWDDDADIALMRSEYEKFREACKTELDTTRFYFQDQTATEGYRWGYGKIRRKDSLFLRENQSHMPYEQGIFIDIFPIDGVPDHYLLRCLHCLHCYCIRKVLWSAVGRFADKSKWKRMWFSLLYKIPHKAVLAHYQKLIQKVNAKKTRLVRMSLFPAPNKNYGSKREWFEESAEIQFENHIFYGAKDYDNYLKFTYGTYMEFPPIAQRKVHPVVAIKIPGEETIIEEAEKN